MNIEKPCPRCKLKKPFEEWTKHKNRPNGVGGYCKICNKEKWLEWRTNNPDAHRRAWLKRKYKITLEQYKDILDFQNGTCALCDKTEGLCVDHDHSTGTVRGILCQDHNKALGLLQDDVMVLKRSIEYLVRSRIL